jgi:hypothetical protein
MLSQQSFRDCVYGKFVIRHGHLCGTGCSLLNQNIGRFKTTFRSQLRIHEEKQTDVMLACSLVTDAALWRVGETAKQTIQVAPNHRLNPRPTLSTCHAAVVVSADIDFLPAAETAASLFSCPVAMAFAFPHTGYKVSDFATAKSKRVFTTEITEDDLRRNMLPSETVLPDGRRIEFRKVKSSHFGDARGPRQVDRSRTDDAND